MPICEYCKRTVNDTLLIKLPKNLRKLKFKKRVNASFCFECIRSEAPNSLDKNGYWYQFVYPHKIFINNRRKY